MRVLICSILMLIPVVTWGQPTREEIDLQDFIEEVFQLQEEELNYEDLYESLYLLYSDPLNLNKANAEDLRSLFLLSNDQIQSFLNYRSANGQLLSIYELQAVPSFDLTTIKKILPFVTVEERPSDTRTLWQRIKEADNKFILLRTDRVVERERGFVNDTSETASSNRFLGGRNSLYSRVRFSRSKDFSIGLTLEKDRGEQFRFSSSNRQYGFDFNSFHFVLENKKNWKSIAVGDYQIQLGQGLVLGAGFNPGKGSETITTVRRSSTGIRPYSSVLETGFFRGVATTYAVGRIDLTGFYSYQRQDANIRRDTTFTAFDEFITSIQGSGFHRTESELQNKDRINEQVIGGNVRYTSADHNFQSGVTFVRSMYSTPLFRTPNSFNQFEFSGDNNYTGGVFTNYVWQNLNFFGEAAISKSGGIGAVGGLIASISRAVSFSMVLRRYDRDFHSFYGNSFGESSRNINESGIYWGLKFNPVRSLILTAYYDRFRFPWLRFRAEAPSEGFEYLFRLTYRASRQMTVYGQFRQENRERNSDMEGNIQLLATGLKRNYLINLDFQASKSISLKSRVQWSDFFFEGEKTSGFAIIQDFNFKWYRLKLGTRFALFDTDDFENRQFAYEKNVLYTVSIPSYNGVGIRNYLLVEYDINRKITLWGRFARTLRNDIDTFGSGRNEINANHRSDLRFQIRYKL